MNKLFLAIINEPRFYKSDAKLKHILEEVKNETGIEFIRKDRDSRRGGVAIAFDSNLVSLKKLHLNCLKNKPKLEIDAARGKIRNYLQQRSEHLLLLPTA